MQKTTIDRWLQKKFVYVCYVYCNSLPHHVPSGIKLDESTEECGGRYLYRFTINNDKDMGELTAHLEVENITYASRVSEDGGMKGKFLNDPNKSFTLQISWLLFIIAIISIILSGLPVKIWNELSADETDGKKKAKISNQKAIDFLN